ncbi:hypothetical protein [Nonomuraea endophytica]|uniref:hypothetical protein n=1 Tax=Nonomuraea endophytica TaxID=714136 RepID=UPI0037C9057A
MFFAMGPGGPDDGGRAGDGLGGRVRERLGLACGACKSDDALWLDLALRTMECAECGTQARVVIDDGGGGGECPFRALFIWGSQ